MQQHPNVPQSHPLKFRTIVHGHGGPRAAINDVIDDREELEEYAADCTGDKDREQLQASQPRFDKEKVIAVALGARVAGSTVEIVAVTQVSGGFVGLLTQISYAEHEGPAPAPEVRAMPTYPHHAVRVKNAAGPVVFRRVDVPQPTTLAVGEEGPQPTTLAVGEEGPVMTTMMVGEEGAPVTTLALGEEGGVARIAGGVSAGGGVRMAPEDPSTLATGEEGGPPTTMATGEEAAGWKFVGGEEMYGFDPSWWYRARGGWGGGSFGGGGGPFGGF